MNKLFYFLIFSFLISLSLALFFIFKPFHYVDNDASQIVCNKNGGAFNIGPNYIYTFTDKFDDFNDSKARKLCEFGAIRDYGNYYQTPAALNYTFTPKLATDSSWGDALLMGSAFFILGFLILEEVNKRIFKVDNKNKLQFFLMSGIVGTILFVILLRTPVTQAFCTRQIARKVVNFRNSAFKYGVIKSPEEDTHIASSTSQLYQNCLSAQAMN